MSSPSALHALLTEGGNERLSNQLKTKEQPKVFLSFAAPEETDHIDSDL
jgi:hypothetical protein